MGRTNVWCPAFREALAARLVATGFEVIDGSSDDSGVAGAIAVYVGDEAAWGVVADRAMWTPTVAVLPTLDVDGFVRALGWGAAAVVVDSPTEVMVDVIQAAMTGDVRLPIAIGQMLALHVPPTNESVAQVVLNDVEEALARLIVEGLSTIEMGDRLGFSDRTVRRRLQGLYLKLKVADRASAEVALAARTRTKND